MTAPAVLTTTSTLTCADQGKVQADTSNRLRVGTVPVLLASIMGKDISACPVVDNTNTSTVKCRKVLSVSAGESSRLTVGGTSVLLDVLAGFSDGAPPAGAKLLAKAAANQTRLRAAVAVV